MNCENCKKRPATVFFADEMGARHSLCASCAKILGKISEYDPSNDGNPEVDQFLPPSALTSMLQKPLIPLCLTNSQPHTRVVCPHCATSLETAVSNASVGCPECYTVFEGYLFPAPRPSEANDRVRMPSAYRERLGRARSITELKLQLKVAVEGENFELAATLRDKLRRLEKHT